jgi:hypothetical protein
MTGKQADWLRSNRTYTAIVSRPPSGYSYKQRGILHADGNFEPTIGKHPHITRGCIEVGVLTQTQNFERR